MRVDIQKLLPELATPGESLTVPDFISRMMEQGYKTIPTMGSIAYSLGNCTYYTKHRESRRTVYTRREI